MVRGKKRKKLQKKEDVTSSYFLFYKLRKTHTIYEKYLLCAVADLNGVLLFVLGLTIKLGLFLMCLHPIF